MDHHQSEAVSRIVVRAKGRDGQRFAIVVLGDGRLGISRNEHLLQTVRFESGDMEACVREFIRRTGIATDTDDHPGEQDPPAP